MLLWVWNFLLALLLFFPFVLGGIAVQRPGLKLELGELAIPTVILACVAWGLSRRLNPPRLIPFWIKRFWDRWNATSPRGVLALTAAVGLLYALVACTRHYYFGSGVSDLGIFTNAIFNLSYFGNYVSSVKDGMNLFQDHQSPVFWLWAPFYRIFPTPYFLLISQSFILASTGFAAWLVARPHLSGWRLACVPLIVWMYLPLRNANAFDFHPEVALLPLSLFAIHAFEQKCWNRAWILFALALLCKESAGPVWVGVALAFGITRALSWRVVGVLILISVAHFYLCTTTVPALFGGAYVYNAQYAHLTAGHGTGAMGLLRGFLSSPVLFQQQVLGKTRLVFLFWTLTGLAFLPLLSPKHWIAALPGYLILFLSAGDHRVNLNYHYGIEPAVGLIWAMIWGLKNLREQVRPIPFINWTLHSWILVLFFVFLAHGRSESFRLRGEIPADSQARAHMEWLRSELLPKINPTLSLSASGSLVPHLANRPWVHHLPHLENATCVLVDPAVNNWPLDTQSAQTLTTQLEALKFEEIYKCHDVHVYQKAAMGESCILEVPRCP